MDPQKSRKKVPLLCAAAVAVAPLLAEAADPSSADDWRYSASIYLWAAGIKGETAAGSDVDVGFDTLLKNLNMTFMGTFEARKAEWSFLTDVVYLNVGVDGGAEVPVNLASGQVATAKVDADLKTKGWVLNLLGGYNLWQAEQGSLDLVGGARYFDLKLDFGLGVGDGAYATEQKQSVSGRVWDAVVGVRGHANLNERWYLPYHLDVGTGQSDLTWQASAGLAYRFDWGDASLGYRHMNWEFDSDSPIDHMSFSGPLLAAKFRF